MFTNKVKMDSKTNQASILDVIMHMCKLTSNNASNVLKRILENQPELSTRCSYIRINGKGKLTPVASARTMI